MPNIQILNPDSLGKPLGQYSQLTRVKASEFLFIAGQVGADKNGKAPPDFDAQCGQVFANIGLALASQGASFANIVEFTTYLVHSQDIPKFMAYRTREFPKLFQGGAYPPNTLLMIDRLVQEQFLIEVSAVAACSSAETVATARSEPLTGCRSLSRRTGQSRRGRDGCAPDVKFIGVELRRRRADAPGVRGHGGSQARICAAMEG